MLGWIPMTNPKLEKRILQISFCLFCIALVVILIVFSERLMGALGLLAGTACGVLIFADTAYLYSQIGKQKPGGQIALSSLLLIFAFLIAAAVLFVTVRLSSHLFFWCDVVGLLLVPTSTLLFVLAEVTGLIHTDYYV